MPEHVVVVGPGGVEHGAVVHRLAQRIEHRGLERIAAGGAPGPELAGEIDRYSVSVANDKRELLKKGLVTKARVDALEAEVLALREQDFPAFTEESLLGILVTGGSQGARVLSEVVPDGLAMLPPALRQRLQVRLPVWSRLILPRRKGLLWLQRV